MAVLKNTRINDSGFFKKPVGTTSQRPSSPEVGMSRLNTDRNGSPVLEFWDGNVWVVLQ